MALAVILHQVLRELDDLGLFSQQLLLLSYLNAGGKHFINDPYDQLGFLRRLLCGQFKRLLLAEEALKTVQKVRH